MSDEKLVLRQSSMQFADPAKQVAEDAKGAIPDAKSKGAPDVIGFTELGAAQELRIVRQRCKEAGYLFHRHGSVGLALHPKHELIEKGGVDVLDGLRTRSGKGSYRPRGIAELTFRTPGGNVVTVHEAHWITFGGGNRQEERAEQSEAMVERVQLHGKGRRLSFWMGDINEDEEKRPQGAVQKPLTRGKLVSVYDALDKYPSTHGNRTIDVVGHYDADGRVTPEKVAVGKVRNSDHKKVDATYTISRRRRRVTRDA